MLPGEDVVNELTQMVWETILGLPVEMGSGSAEEIDLVTWVEIHGAWKGTVEIRFPLDLARSLAAIALERSDAEETTPEEVRDVVGELANVLGGNLKGLVPGPCKLSLPHVETRASAAEATEEGATRLAFRCSGKCFEVRVKEHEVGSSS